MPLVTYWLASSMNSTRVASMVLIPFSLSPSFHDLVLSKTGNVLRDWPWIRSARKSSNTVLLTGRSPADQSEPVASELGDLAIRLIEGNGCLTMVSEPRYQIEHFLLPAAVSLC